MSVYWDQPGFMNYDPSSLDNVPVKPLIPWGEISGADFADVVYNGYIPQGMTLEVTTTTGKTQQVAFRLIVWRGPPRLLKAILLPKKTSQPQDDSYFSLTLASIQSLVSKAVSMFSSTPAPNIAAEPKDTVYFEFYQGAWEDKWDKGNNLGVVKTISIIR